MRKKLLNDEVDRHPFYSDDGLRRWKKRLKELELQEKELSKRRPKTNGEGVQEVDDQKD
jgi:hypothetical protein